MRPDKQRVRRLLAVIEKAQGEWRALWPNGVPVSDGGSADLVSQGLEDAKTGLQQFARD